VGETRLSFALAVAALALPACTKGDPSGPTSVYLTIQNGPGLPVPDELRVTARGDNGPLFANQRLPEMGALVPPAGGGSLLGTVTLYVGAGTSRLDIDVSGLVGGEMRSDGVTSVAVVAGKQVSATVQLAALGDADAHTDDGGPDASQDVGSTDAGVDADCSGSSLSGAVSIPPTTPVDLTAEGTVDWRHWGLSGLVDFKVTGGQRISDYTEIGNGASSDVMRSALTFSWSDGTPRQTVTGAPAAPALAGVGSGFDFTVSAEPAARTLAVYVSGENDTGVLTASLSDGCVSNYTMSGSGSQIFAAVHRITFRSAVPGAELHVTWTMTAGTGAIALHAATLY
jgi:hypothetical protein